MKQLTYEDLKPWLTEETKLWTEDDVTKSTLGHEGSSAAWKKLFGCEQPSATTAVAKTDWGDAGGSIFADGRVSFWAYDGGTIYQLPAAAMQALGLAVEVLPYPKHTPPASPEGTKWGYLGRGKPDYLSLDRKYFVRPDGTTSAEPSDIFYEKNRLHYFEAVPDFANMSPDECLRGKNLGFTHQELEAVQNGLKTAYQSSDPKGAAAAHKAPLHLLPSFPLHETAHVLKHGGVKYGEFNWRSNKVAASVYRSAMQRHLDQWFDGLEDADSETSRSHLAHVIASACIVLDAGKHGTLVDDRPYNGEHGVPQYLRAEDVELTEEEKSRFFYP